MYHDHGIMSQYETASQQTRAATDHILKGSVLGVSSARDRGQLEVAVDSIGNSIGELGACIDQLEKTLTPVLQCATTQATGHNSAAPPPAMPISPAVGYLVEQRRRIEMLVLRVNDIRSRLDT